MTTTPTLFIGGTADGQRLNTDPDAQFWDVPRPVDRKVFVEDAPEITYRTDTYSRMRFGAPGRTFEAFVLDGMSPAEAMQVLMDNYKPDQQ